MHMFLPCLTAFIGLVLIWFEKHLVSTLLKCGIGSCADDPLKYAEWIWLRPRFGF